MVGSTGSLPRNLAATLQDIEAKRQLALQQKGGISTHFHSVCLTTASRGHCVQGLLVLAHDVSAVRTVYASAAAVSAN